MEPQPHASSPDNLRPHLNADQKYYQQQFAPSNSQYNESYGIPMEGNNQQYFNNYQHFIPNVAANTMNNNVNYNHPNAHYNQNYNYGPHENNQMYHAGAEMYPQENTFGQQFQNYNQFNYDNRGDYHHFVNNDNNDHSTQDLCSRFNNEIDLGTNYKPAPVPVINDHKNNSQAHDTKGNAEDFSPGIEFRNGYTMQSLGSSQYQGQNDNNSRVSSAFVQPFEFDTAQELYRKEENSLEPNQEQKESRSRRKSSTLDMFNDPVNFLQQVDEQIEKVPEQHSNEASSESLSTPSDKDISPLKPLKGRLSVKKNTAPYRPSNYKHEQMSPSPKRTNMLQTVQTQYNGGKDFYQGHYGSTNFENPGFMAQESNDFSLKLNKAQSAHPVTHQPMLQRAHSFSMGYNDTARIQAYPSNMIQPGINHMQDGANMSANPFVQSNPYAGSYERE
jgi:hypothetical protein